MTFQSSATDLIVGDTNGVEDIFTRRRGSGFEENVFTRGDANGDGGVNVTDMNFIPQFLFNQGPPPPCMDSADVNDDGVVSITDPIFLGGFLFDQGPPIPEPNALPPGRCPCSVDPTEDTLTCSVPNCS